MLKPSVFSTLSLAALLLLLLLCCSTLSNYALQSAASQSKIHSVPALRPSVEEETEGGDPDPVLVPLNVTEPERIAWFRENLHLFEILNPGNSTGKFASRAAEFLGQGCDGQFFMTWISRARSFGEREILCVETLFKANPGGCLLILSETMDSRSGCLVLRRFTDRGYRVAAMAPDLPSLFRRTPAENWFHRLKTGNVDPGEIPLPQNLSNLLRLAVLFKFGGVYLDTDFIVMKKLAGIRNAVGAQTMDAETGKWSRLNNAFLAFDRGHPLLLKFMEEFSQTYNGNRWGYNGPYLVSRVTERVEKNGGLESNFTVLPPMALYPVNWNHIEGLFQRPRGQRRRKWAATKLLQLSGDTLAIHLWNKQSSRLEIEDGSVMSRLIESHCIFCRKSSSS